MTREVRVNEDDHVNTSGSITKDTENLAKFVKQMIHIIKKKTHPKGKHCRW